MRLYCELRYGRICSILRISDHRIHIEVEIELIFIENVYNRLNFHKKLVSFKNIDICPIDVSKSIIFGANLRAYSILLINQLIKALASARGSEKRRKKIEKKSEKNPKKNQKNRASAYICFCRLRAKSRI